VQMLGGQVPQPALAVEVVPEMLEHLVEQVEGGNVIQGRHGERGSLTDGEGVVLGVRVAVAHDQVERDLGELVGDE
jgi:ribose 5-phosphate isomerase